MWKLVYPNKVLDILPELIDYLNLGYTTRSHVRLMTAKFAPFIP